MLVTFTPCSTIRLYLGLPIVSMLFVWIIFIYCETSLKLLHCFSYSYQSTLKQLFQEFDQGEDANSQLARVTMRIMQALQNNLDGKSKQYKDPALTHLFLMNNIHYIVRSVRRYAAVHWFIFLCGFRH